MSRSSSAAALVLTLSLAIRVPAQLNVESAASTVANTGTARAEIDAVCDALRQAQPLRDEQFAELAAVLLDGKLSNGRLRAGEVIVRIATPAQIQRLMDAVRSAYNDGKLPSRPVMSVIARELKSRDLDAAVLARLWADLGEIEWLLRLPRSPEHHALVIRALRNARPALVLPAGCLYCELSDAGMPEIRRYFGELRGSAAPNAAFDICLRFLVEADDRQLLAELPDLIADARFGDARREQMAVYLVKLKHQHSKEELVRVLETERRWSVLWYAAQRLLHLGAGKQTIRTALEKNAGAAGADRSPAAAVSEALFKSTPEERAQLPPRDLDCALTLDREELASMCDALKRNPTALGASEFSLNNLLARAAEGE